MDRPRHAFGKLALIAAVLMSGCQPTQPFFLNEDGDLSHYIDHATDIEFPDVDSEPLPDAAQASQPHTLLNPETMDFWDLSLEETVSISLQNSKVIRSIAQVRQSRQVGQGVAGPAESLTLNPDFTPTIYDTAIEESGQNGVEAALSAFDTQWNTSLFWDRTDRPQNVTPTQEGLTLFPRILQQDQMNFQSELTKRAATGTQWSFRNVTNYDSNNRPLRVLASEWLTSWEAEARHPLLRGSGAQVNRVPVTIARIRTDISLVQYSVAVRNHLIEVERAYWDLYFFYRNLQAAKVGRDSALGTWQRIAEMVEQSGPSVTGEQESQAREQYYFFRGRVEEAKRDLLIAERQLRYLMGIAPTDGRVIRPSDAPTFARVEFDWSDILTESLTRSDEVRRQKWLIKQREVELIAARNGLMPQLDMVALYRWLGSGDNLIDDERNGLNFPSIDSTAFDELAEGRYAEWRLGLDMRMPLGARAAHASVRNQQLLLARERARLEDLELEVSHSLTDAVQRLDANYALARTAFLQSAAAKEQVRVLETKLEFSTISVDLLLDVQRRAAQAEQAFYQALLQYNLAILEVHFRKGSLLEYCGVSLQEGPWPAKAYFDALIRARQRDASYYFDYGYSRPKVVSRGRVPQNAEEAVMDEASMNGSVPAMGTQEPTPAEPLPAPMESGPANGQPSPAPQEAALPAGQVELTSYAEETPAASGNSGQKFQWDGLFE